MVMSDLPASSNRRVRRSRLPVDEPASRSCCLDSLIREFNWRHDQRAGDRILQLLSGPQAGLSVCPGDNGQCRDADVNIATLPPTVETPLPIAISLPFARIAPEP